MSQHPRACQNILEYVRTSQGMSRHPRVCQDIPEQVKTSQGHQDIPVRIPQSMPASGVAQHRNVHPWGAGRKTIPSALCLVPKDRQEGTEGAKLFARSHPSARLGFGQLKDRKQLIPHRYEMLKQRSPGVSLFLPG